MISNYLEQTDSYDHKTNNDDNRQAEICRRQAWLGIVKGLATPGTMESCEVFFYHSVRMQTTSARSLTRSSKSVHFCLYPTVRLPHSI